MVKVKKRKRKAKTDPFTSTWQAVDAKDGVHTIFEEAPTKNLEPAPTRLDVLMGEFESELNRVISKLKATF